MPDIVRAVTALRDNVKGSLLLAFRDSDFIPGEGRRQVWDEQVDCYGKLGGATVGPALDFREGDTMLHLAMRNKKWLAKTACHELGVDASIPNALGETPPMMALWSSSPRMVSTLVVTIVTWNMARLWNLAGPVGFAMELLCLAFASADFFLALRFCYIVFVLKWYHHAKKSGINPATEKPEPGFLDRVMQKREEARLERMGESGLDTSTAASNRKKKGKKHR